MAESDDNTTWHLALETAMTETCSLEDLRMVCRGHILPEVIRAQVWSRFLGINPLSCELGSFKEIFDLHNQSLLHENCKSVVEKLGNDEEDKVAIMSDIESIITLFCKSHNTLYNPNNGWLEILIPLSPLKLPRNELYAFFNAILDSYIPRHCCQDGAAVHLFRLLLLYHDPELCSFLDSHKITADLYTLQWFSTLFAGACNISASVALWDYYFVHSDPFLIFFLALVLLLNAKEELMTLKGDKQKILDVVGSLPQQMDAADVPDFCSLAVLYSAQTPISYKRAYHQVLFGEDLPVELLESSTTSLLSQALCLSVSVNELLVSCGLIGNSVIHETENRSLRFFLVDCRPAEQYNAGHLPTAFHLDSNLMLTEPQAFSVAVQALLSAQKQSIAAQSAAGGEHLAFLGSGREAEDQYVHMVVAFFLQRHVQFVSLVQGGFQDVHEALVLANCDSGSTSMSVPVGLIDHNPLVCLVCLSNKQVLTSTRSQNEVASDPSSKSYLLNKIRSKTAVVKGKIIDYIINPNGNTSSDESLSKSSKNPTTSGQKGRSGKLYRNLTPIFSIDDDQDDEATFEGVLEQESEVPKEELVSISAWLKKSEVIESFRCEEVKESGHAYSSYLLITPTHLYALREIENRPGFARVSVSRSLTSIMKITSKKRHPELITFKYGTTQGDTTIITDMDRFIIPQAGDAVKLVKQQLFNSVSAS